MEQIVFFSPFARRVTAFDSCRALVFFTISAGSSRLSRLSLRASLATRVNATFRLSVQMIWCKSRSLRQCRGWVCLSGEVHV